MKAVILITVGLLLCACTRATDTPALPTAAPGVVYAASGPVELPQALALTNTPTPPATATPEWTLTALSREATEIYVASARQLATQQAKLDAIAEQASAGQAAVVLAGAQRQADAQAQAVEADSRAIGAEAEARATLAAVQVTQASAFALTALPAAATRVWHEAAQAEAQAETARRVNVVAVWLQAAAGLGLVLAFIWAVFGMWNAWRRAGLEHARQQAEIDLRQADVEAKLSAARRVIDQVFQSAPTPAAPTDAAITEARRVFGWRASCLALAMYANEFRSWTYDDLGPEGAQVVSRPAWDRLTDYLADCGFLTKRNNVRTRWGEGVTYDSFREATRQAFPKSFPSGEPPAVRAPGRSTDAQSAHAAQSAQV